MAFDASPIRLYSDLPQTVTKKLFDEALRQEIVEPTEGIEFAAKKEAKKEIKFAAIKFAAKESQFALPAKPVRSKSTDVKLLANRAAEVVRVFSNPHNLDDFDFGRLLQFVLEVVGLVLTEEPNQKNDERAKALLRTLESIEPARKVEITLERDFGTPHVTRVSSSLIGILRRYQNPFSDEKLRLQITTLFRQETKGKPYRAKIAWHLDKMLCYEGTCVAEWKNVQSAHAEEPYPKEELTAIIAAGKWLTLEFSEERAEKMARWISGLHVFAARYRLNLVKVMVLADFSKIEPHMRSIWAGVFGEAGALFERFPDGSTTFLQAMMSVDSDLAIQTGRLGSRREITESVSA